MIELPNSEVLALVSPEDVAGYLASHGWRKERGMSNAAELWLHDGPSTDLDLLGSAEELVLPVRTEYLDYAKRMAEVIGTLCHVERRSSAYVLRDILTGQSDVVRLRRPNASAEGAIALSDGVTLVDQAFAMVTAAACSAVVRRRVTPTRRPLSAQEYLRRVRLGQTEQSSYVITIISPVKRLESEVPTLFQDTEEPFPRRVTRTLASALSGLEYATATVKRNGDFRVFEDVVGAGVSANMCEAISSLVSAPERESEISIQIDWALGHPVNDGAVRFTFFPEAEPYLQEAAKRLRAAEPLEGTLVAGVVVRLQRRREELVGRITLSCVVDGALRQLSVPLGLADYQQAVEAHREQKGVMLRADILKDGKRYVASNVREFRVT